MQFGITAFDIEPPAYRIAFDDTVFINSAGYGSQPFSVRACNMFHQVSRDMGKNMNMVSLAVSAFLCPNESRRSPVARNQLCQQVNVASGRFDDSRGRYACRLPMYCDKPIERQSYDVGVDCCSYQFADMGNAQAVRFIADKVARSAPL